MIWQIKVKLCNTEKKIMFELCEACRGVIFSCIETLSLSFEILRISIGKQIKERFETYNLSPFFKPSRKDELPLLLPRLLINIQEMEKVES